MHLVVVCDSDTVREALGAVSSAEVSVTSFSRKELFAPLSEDVILSGELFRGADGLLMEWDMQHGFELRLLSLRAHQRRVPLIAICKNSDFERTAALLTGADACVPIPLNASLLRAIVLAFCRTIREVDGCHVEGTAVGPLLHDQPFRRLGTSVARRESIPKSVVLDRQASRLTFGCHHTHLTPRECELLCFFVKHRDKIVSRDRILDEVWQLDFETGTNAVDVYVHYLRHKLDAIGLPNAIRTVRGKGYLLRVPDTVGLRFK